MNEQVSKEAVTLGFRFIKGVGRGIERAIMEALHEIKAESRAKYHAVAAEKAREKAIAKRNAPGEVSVKKLMMSGEEVNTAELHDPDLKLFERELKKNGVQYGLRVNKDTDPPTYFLYFKARNADVVYNTINNFINKEVKPEQGKEGPEPQKGKSKEKSRQAREPIKQKLNRYKQKVKQAGAKKTKTRTNTKVR